ncbi:MAG: hypothetical protein AAF558_12290 [Verrucomicrobiota bacterium]
MREKILLLLSSLFAACATPIPKSQLSSDLLYLISPVSEIDSEYRKTIKLCDCVIASASKEWKEEKFQDFEIELRAYVSGIEKQTPKSLFTKGLPERSKALQTYLESLSEYVQSCEDQIGVNVEF